MLKKGKLYGQPTCQSHPHLLSEGELTPLVQRSEYQARRQRLLESIVSHTAKRNKDLKRHLVKNNIRRII